jgi:MFS superfamily sulfate permease-like transporter
MLTSLVSALLLLSVLLYLGPYFESLPVCVLGAIIMVSLTGLLLKVGFRSEMIVPFRTNNADSEENSTQQAN